MRSIPAIAFLMAAAVLNAAEEAPSSSQTGCRVILDYFFEQGCADCYKMDSVVMPLLRQKYGGCYVLNERELSVETNYLALIGTLERLGVNDNASLYMVVDGKEILAGYPAIAGRLFPVMEERRLTRRRGEAGGPTSERFVPQGRELLQRRFERFTVGCIVANGLIDGINPCAFSTAVFLVSVLMVMRISGARLLLVGLAFCLASFLTYMAIGFGLLHAIRTLSCFHVIRRAIDLVLVAVLAVLAFFSFRDALRYRGSQEAGDVTIRLPDTVKTAIHRIIREGLGGRARVVVAFGLGAAVTALESVCTAQVYLPTLVLAVKSGLAVTHGVSLLILYNIMFILPLAIVFLLTWRSLRLSMLLELSVKNVVLSKLLMGCLFLVLAGAIIVLR